MINCGPHNPKAEGNVECSYHSLRQKIYYDLIQQKKMASTGLRAYPTI